MTPAQIISFTRTLSGCRTDEIPDSDLLSYMNIEYRKLWQDIAGIDKNYKLRVRSTNIVTGVSSYALLLPVQAPGTPATGQIKIEEVYIKYSADQTYRYRADQRDWDNLTRAPEWYADNCPQSKAFYIIMDNSIQIFPTPNESIPNGLELYSSQRPYDLTVTMLETDILLEREFHDVIGWAMIPYIYQHRQQDDRVGYYENQYEIKKLKMLRLLKKRAIRPMQGYNASFSKYVY